jgi:hypothetical protein
MKLALESYLRDMIAVVFVYPENGECVNKETCRGWLWWGAGVVL